MERSNLRVIAITGGTGLLGRELTKHFGETGMWNVAPLDRAEVDVTDPGGVDRTIARLKPDTIVNCAVILDVDRCEADPEACFSVNRDGVKNLLTAAGKLEKPPTFVQIGSSEIFGRVKPGEYRIHGYRESDEPKPVSSYQRSKKEAEDALTSFVARNPNTLKHWYIARAGWLYGEGQPTFVDRFATLLQSKEPLTVIKDQWRSPTWTRDFARSLASVLENNLTSGVYHLTAEVKHGEATTMDVIEEIERHLGKKSARPKITFTTQAKFFKVPRAPSNVLLNTKLPKLPYWRDSLAEYLREKYPSL